MPRRRNAVASAWQRKYTGAGFTYQNPEQARRIIALMRRLVSRGRSESDAIAFVTEAVGINLWTVQGVWNTYKAQNPVTLLLPQFTKHCPYCGVPLHDGEQAEIFDHRRKRIKAHRFCVRLSMLLCSVVTELYPLRIGGPKTRH